ncbi:hypothetical protein I2I11_17090 [Pontibacter sp. 172403-2]|uniref:hypothetical protein n=1 Tax=Pontibacter rufus TaxID=2791028 RepID=UPI0018AFB5B4|nr:hypothetical protein [Pontibacter sp. 172403-2]MBF9255019.1 hypothetical protein [Pontibacter sp. 172403-2]
MEKENLFQGHLKLTTFCYFKDSNTWNFNFEEKVILQSECLWRFLGNGKIRYTSNDHGQRYGLERPLDLEKEIKELLHNYALLRIGRNLMTGDLYFEFDKEYKFELLTDSIGFENWSLNVNSNLIIGLGQGDVARFE